MLDRKLFRSLIVALALGAFARRRPRAIHRNPHL